MIDIGLERLERVNLDGCADALRIREHAVEETETLLYRFSTLPVEIQITIFEFAIEGESSKLITLTHVCRRWREMIIAIPSFWRHVSLSEKTTQNEADTRLHRAGGLLSSLHIDYGFSFKKLPGVFRNAAPDVCSHLDSFEVQRFTLSPELDAMLTEILSQLQVERLRIILDVPRPSSKFLKALFGMEAPRLRWLSLQAGGQMALSRLSLPSLTNLELSGYVQTDDLLAFVERHSRIGTLVLNSSEKRSMNVHVSKRTVMLADLKSLTLSGSWGEDAFFRSIFFPNLEVLTILPADGSEGWLKAIASQRLVQLETVSLDVNVASTTTVIDFLQQADSIRHLTLDLSYFYGDDTVVIAALSERIPARDGHDQSDSLCCPRLQHLSVTANNDSIGRPLVQLVKARLPRAALPSGIDPGPAVSKCRSQGDSLPLPIISLDLDLVNEMELNLLTWLKANVEQVSYMAL